MSDTGEGEKLAKLLDDNRYKKIDLAKIVGVTKQAVDGWVRLKKFSPKVWEKIRTGLDGLGLSPEAIRTENGRAPKEPVEDLTRLVAHWTPVQLYVIKRILESDDAARRLLLFYVNGALREKP